MSYRKLATHPLHSLLRSAFTRAAAGALGAAAPLAVLANPTGGQVVGGTAIIGSAGANGVVVTQGSQRAIINWQQFSVGSGQYVQFVQPNSSAVVLNRVTGSNPSSIFGDIIANGQVFLVNPNGVYFAPGASIDVQGLVASTLDLDDSDFMQGRYVFSKAPGAPDAGVVNAGGIHAGPGGYVVLAGDYASNSGAIVAQTGRVYLAAGDAATLTFDSNELISYVVDGKTLSRLAGVSNSGEIAANGGLVVMTADVADTLTATAVNNSGLITAHSVSEQGGEIVLRAEGGDIENSGTLDASADVTGVAGGTVIVHGDGQTWLTKTSVIDAEGDGAQGGFVDVSGHDLSLRGSVLLGKAGTLLIDPSKLFITDGNTAGASITSGDYVGAQFIQGQLNAGANVVLVASNSIVAGVPLGLPSNIHAATSIVATGTGALTIKTGQLQIHSGGTPTGSLIGLTPSHCGLGICTPRTGTPTTAYAFTPTSGIINLTGMTISIKGGFTANASHGAVTLSDVSAKTVTVTGTTISLGGNVTATGGKLAITAIAAGPVPASVTVTAGKVLTGSSVAISASGSYGGMITAGDIHATGGSLVLHAHANTSHSATVQTGNLIGEYVSISAAGLSPKIKTGSITANGTVSSASGPKHDFIRLNATGGGASTSIIISGPVLSSHGSVSLAAGSGVVHVNSITAHTNVRVTGPLKVSSGGISLTGGKISVAGSMSAGGGDVVITGTGSFSAGNIVAAAGGVQIQTNLGASTGGRIRTGNITARNISLSATARRGAQISAGTLHATGGAGSGDISLFAHATGGVSSSGGNITVNGITADHGAVHIDAQGGQDSGGQIKVNGAIKAAGKVNILAVGLGSCCDGTVSIVGNVTGQFVDIEARETDALATSGAKISINGNVTATGTAPSASPNSGVTIIAGSSAARYGKPQISVSGNVTASHGGVTLSDWGKNGGRSIDVGHSSAGVWTSGAIKASRLSIQLGGSGAAAVHVGQITAGGSVSINDLGKTDVFSFGPVTAGGAFTYKSKGALNLSGHTLQAGKGVTLQAATLNIGNAAITAGGAFSASAQGAAGVLTAGNGAITATAISLKSGGIVSVSGETLKTTGGGTFAASAGGSLGLTGVTLTAGAVTAKAGIVDLTSAHINAGGAVTLTATQHILLGKTAVKAGGAFSANAHGSISDGGSAGSINDAAGATFKAGTGKVVLNGETLVTGSSKLAFSVAGSVALNGAHIHAGGMTVAAVGNLNMTGASVTATSIQAVTGGSIDLSGDTIAATGAVQLTAGLVAAQQPLAAKDIVLSGVNINVGTFAAVAGGTIHNGGATGTLTANGLALTAGKDINLASTQITVGNASLASLPSDTLLMAALAAAGLSPATPKPNAYFNAGGTLTLGKFTLTGTYLYLQAANINVLGPVSTPTDSVIQFAPVTGPDSIGVEQTPGTGSVMNLSNSLLLSLFPATTLVIGNGVESGAVTLGSNGPFDIGSSNLIIETTGSVTGLNNVTSTGLISTVQSLLASQLPPPTPSEIDPNSSNNNNTAGKHRQQGDYDPDAGTGSGGTISQSTDIGGACH